MDLRETYRQQLLDSIGGWTGTVIAAIPPVVFVIVNSIGGLRAAVISAVASAAALTLYRLIRRQSIQQALTGLFGVVIAALIAARTGQARGYFLLGIWSSFLYGGVFVVSMLVRRPVVGLLWEFLDPTPAFETTAERDEPPWYRRGPLLRAYLLATAGGAVVFLARGVVQLALFRQNATGWLAFARIAMGYPLWILAVGFAFWVVRRARLRVAARGTPAA
ncbi:MAG: hypothetical protein QOG80_316 [Pseudonocardiales bacterium]|nr:hypothetical protein [Pseudonocardiales bacterium]